MNNINKLINYGILFSLILGTFAHFAYSLSEQNKIIGYFVPINESIWEHIKLSVFPIIIYMFFMYFYLGKSINNLGFALGIGILLSVIIIPTLFYTYVTFTKDSFLIFDIIIFIISIIIPFKVIQKIILLPELPNIFNIIGLAIVILVVALFFRFTYNPINHKIFNEGDF